MIDYIFNIFGIIDYINKIIIYLLGIITYFITLIYNLLSDDLVSFILNIIYIIWSSSKNIIDEILVKNFNSESYLSIILSTFNINEYIELYNKVIIENQQNNIYKMSDITFPLPKLTDEPDSIANPTYIILIMKFILSIVFILLFGLFSMLIFNIVNIILKLNIIK